MTKPRTIKSPSRLAAATKAPITILDAALDPHIFGPWFKNVKSWATWFAFLRAVFGLPLDDAELATFQKFTGRTAPLPEGYLEATLAPWREKPYPRANCGVPRGIP
jgi:hypothetical protein